MNDYILHTSYEDLADVVWQENDSLPPSGIVHVHADNVCEFFRRIEGTSTKYILVSSNSDYGFQYNDSNLLIRNMQRYLHMVDCSDLGYNSLLIPSRHRLGYCKVDDKFAVTMYSWTKGTFNKIPDNIIKWFSTNNELDDPRIINIPFGIPEWTANLLSSKKKKEKFSIYVNFQNNTFERLTIKNLYSQYPDVIVEDNVSKEQYVSSLQQSPYILSLPGNGCDCYRTLESVYCGSLPVIFNSLSSRAYDNIPSIKVNSYVGIYDELKDLWEKLSNEEQLFLDTPQMYLLHWAELIEMSRNLL